MCVLVQRENVRFHVVVTCAKVVMFYPAFVCLFVCLSVCLFAASRKNTSRTFAKILAVVRICGQEQLIKI